MLLIASIYVELFYKWLILISWCIAAVECSWPAGVCWILSLRLL